MACTLSDSPRPHASEAARQSFHFVGKTMLIRHGAESRVHDWYLTFIFTGRKGAATACSESASEESVSDARNRMM
jgi:hypothetical protein